jgi:ribose transport system substrate-binding protein
VKFSWGTFKLAPRIANKLQNNEPLNILFSMEGKTIPIYGPQYLYNFPKGIAQAQDDWGLQLKGKLIGPVQFNSNEQIAQVRSELATGQWDCLVIEPGSLDAFAPVINKAVDSGIPVFTTGTDVPRSKRFGTFHTDWVYEGGLDARTAVAYLKKKGIPLKAAYMSTGNIDAKTG